ENGAPALRWLGSCSWTANQLLASARPLLGPVELAREFLLDFLAAGPRPCREIWHEAKKRPFGRSSLNKARELLTITSKQGWAGDQFLSFWCLPGQKSPLATRDPNCADLDEFLERYRELYPSRTPLEEED